MNRILALALLTMFAIFVGSQITEGIILLPHWKSLSTADFYIYYDHFGPSIAMFYTILTVVSVLICLSLSVYCFLNKSTALKYALIATAFMIVCIAMFYIYFKSTNQLFYQAKLTTIQLDAELKVWEIWHWCRVVIEVISLIFLILTVDLIINKRAQ